MDALHHARSSVAKWGGEVEDYLPIHRWFDESKHHLADVRHRALRHHTMGIEQAMEKFGEYLINSANKTIPVRYIGEQHMMEDLGIIPTFSDWMRGLKLDRWMSQPGKYSQDGRGGLVKHRRLL